MLTPPFPSKINPFGAPFRNTLNEIGESAASWEERADDIESRLAVLEAKVGRIHNCFPVVLNTAKLMTGEDKRWKYGWEEYIPGLAFSPKGLPGQGTTAETGDRETWLPTAGQRSSWGNDGTTAYSADDDPYGFYAINMAEIENDDVTTSGYVSYGVKVGTGPGGTGDITLLSVGNVADADEDDNRRVVVWVWEMMATPSDTVYPDNTSGFIYAFSAGNDVEVSCT